MHWDGANASFPSRNASVNLSQPMQPTVVLENICLTSGLKVCVPKKDLARPQILYNVVFFYCYILFRVLKKYLQTTLPRPLSRYFLGGGWCESCSELWDKLGEHPDKETGAHAHARTQLLRGEPLLCIFQPILATYPTKMESNSKPVWFGFFSKRQSGKVLVSKSLLKETFNPTKNCDEELYSSQIWNLPCA